MPAFILGEKREQSQLFTDEGDRVATTFIRTTPCFVTAVMTKPAHTYFSVQLGFGQIKNIKKTVKGQLKKAGIETPLHFLREVRLEQFGEQVKYVEEEGKKGLQIKDAKLYVGTQIDPTAFFKKGDKLVISGVSKGKGFQGVVKRHAFKGGPKTHGQSDRERAPGSIGMTTTPGRIFRGKRMAGRMGGERITLKNIEVVAVTKDGIMIKGAIPGAKNGLIEIKKMGD